MKEIVNDGFAKVVKPYMDAQDKKSREIIAPVEVSPAEAPHSVGDQIIYNGLLYDVTAPIEVEDSLETSGAGANISDADNIEAQIKATKSQIQAAAAQAAAQNKKTQKMLAPVEEDETDASRAYVIGEQLILDGILYNVIDPIAQHGIITAEGAGANIEEADDVTTQLSSLNQTLTNEIDKAYQTDDAAITEVASDDLLPVYDTSATAKKKIAVNNFIGGLVSNRNLLDNPWFEINQRNVSTGWNTQFSFGPDRWRKASNTSKTLVVSDNGISEANGDTFSVYSILDLDRDAIKKIFGKTITASVLYSDGVIESGTLTLQASDYKPSSTIVRYFIRQQDQKSHTDFLQLENYTNSSNFVIGVRAGYTVKAVKLELGPVSTLAMDTAPNYAEELLKCQRYFYRDKGTGTYGIFGSLGYVNSATDVRIQVIFPTTMRANPTISKNGTLAIFDLLTVTDIASSFNVDTSLNQFCGASGWMRITGVSGLSKGIIAAIRANNDNTAYIDFSADL